MSFADFKKKHQGQASGGFAAFKRGVRPEEKPDNTAAIQSALGSTVGPSPSNRLLSSARKSEATNRVIDRAASDETLRGNRLLRKQPATPEESNTERLARFREQDQALEQGTRPGRFARFKQAAQNNPVGQVLFGTGEELPEGTPFQFGRGTIQTEGLLGGLLPTSTQTSSEELTSFADRIASAGIDPNRSLELSNQFKGANTGEVINAPDLTDEERRAILDAQLGVTKDFALEGADVLDFGLIGATRRVSDNVLRNLARDTSRESIERTLRNTLPDIDTKALNRAVDEVVNASTEADVRKVLDNASQATPTAALAEEARRFDSAEEFVEAQKKLFFGGGKFNPKETGVKGGGGTSFSLDEDVSKKFADEFTKEFGKPSKLTQLFLSPDARIARIEDIPDRFFADKQGIIDGTVTPRRGFAKGTFDNEVFDELLPEWARENGFDGIDLTRLQGAEKEIRIVNPDVLKTRSQLTDIYNQAHSAPKTPTSEPIESPFVDESIYEANRNVGGRGLSTVRADASNKASSAGGSVSRILAPISTRLKNIDPSLKQAIRRFEFNIKQASQADEEAVKPFLKKTRGVFKGSSDDWKDLDLALKNGDETKINSLIEKHGLEEEFTQVRNVLNDIHRRAEEVGYDLGYRENYYPRAVKDSQGLIRYLEGTDDWSIVAEAIARKEADLGRYLEEGEKIHVINGLLRGYQKNKITLSETANMRERGIEVLDANLNQFYHDFPTALSQYINQVNEAIEGRRFFGKVVENDGVFELEDTIGSYTMRLMQEGKIKPSQEKELRDILYARFNQKKVGEFVGVYKNLSYIDTMGSVTSAVTQLGDLAFALYRGGLKNALKGVGQTVTRKSFFTKQDLGIERIAEEFNTPSRSAKLVDQVFRLTGLNAMDTIGKETIVNATINSYIDSARRATPNPRFINRLRATFGDEYTEVLNDLRQGNITENVKVLAFNELADLQPILPSEMPEKYLRGGNGRIFYMLKTYTIKQFDIYRNEILDLYKTGNNADKVEATKRMVQLAGALILMNATADEIKDLILDRETSLEDRTVDNVARLFGISKWTLYEARGQGIAEASLKTILPPAKAIDAIVKDAVRTATGDAEGVADTETPASIPLVGKLYYWWFGKGRSKELRGRDTDTDTGIPDLPALPTLPKLPKLPELPTL